MEEVNLDEESTGSVLYGAKFDQYCTVSDLTQLNLLASKPGREWIVAHKTLAHETKQVLNFDAAIQVYPISMSLKSSATTN